LLHSLGVLVLSAGLMAGIAFFRLSIHSYRLAHLRRHLPATPVPMEARQILDQQIATLGLQVPVRLIVTSHNVVPLTFGWRRPVIVIPASLLDDTEALRLTLLHELVHIRRGDYLMQWIGNVVGALFAIHPVVWLLRREIEGYRELACDAAVLGQPHISSKRYAALLYQFALIRSHPPQLALSMAASHRELKNRITAMKSFKATVYRYSPRLVAMTLASLLMGLTTFVVACTDFVGPDPEAETAAAKFDNAEVFVVVEEMPELIGGLEAIQQDLQYPKIAKMAGIEGRVFIEFTVDAQGKVVNPQVVRGIGAGCDEEALRAVQQATFKPGIQDGKAVPVKMSIPVTFRLNDDPLTTQSAMNNQKVSEGVQKLAMGSATLHEGAINLKQETITLRTMTGERAHSLRAYVNGQLLKEGTDYTVDLQEGTLSIINPNYLNPNYILHIEFDD
jgi:TonB family protein